MGFVRSVAVIFLIAAVFSPSSARSAHRPADSRCFDCHVVGGSLADVVGQSHLIRGGDDMTEIVNAGSPGWWTNGNPLPCIYCHDETSRSVRENMVGVKEHFTAASISKHPVDPFESYSIDNPSALDCIDCHDSAVVEYVFHGTPQGTSLSPNIHERDVAAVGWTPEPGLLDHTATFKAWVASAISPYNAGGNTFCTAQCHNALPGTGFDADQVYHQFRTPLVSLETGATFHTGAQIGGCLYQGSGSTGCHAAHNAANNTDLITAPRWNASLPIGRGDCGACHVFDDPPQNRNVSDFYARGHGRFPVGCLNCHDADIAHFEADGTPATGASAGRLSYVLDSNMSGFSDPPETETSICASSSCHTGYYKHTAYGSGPVPAGPVVGCLDCHEPHGAGISGNVAMVRRTPPVTSPASSLYYASSGDWYNSASPPAPGNFSNFVCDQEDCHGGAGPGPYVDLAGGVHPDVAGGCDSCHQHTSPGHSWAAPCNTCHGYPPVTGSDMDHSATLNPLDMAGFLGAHDGCLVCHGKSSGAYHPNYSSTMHSDGSVAMNSQVGYDDNGGCDAACHANDATHRMGTSATRGVNLVAFGTGSSLSCRTCHESGAYGAPLVPLSTTPHLDPDGDGTTWSRGDCKGCHAGHAGSADAVTIPLPPASWSDPSGRLTGVNMQARLGIAYTLTGHNGMALGGQGTAAAAFTTEAEICWGCHDDTGVSEWGYNTKTNTTMSGFSPVWGNFPTQHDGTGESKNYGWIYQSDYSTPETDWTAGFWMSEYDALLRRRIASVHSVSFDPAGQSASVAANVVSGTNKVRQGIGGNPRGDYSSPVLEEVRYIRCSYCHDVHDTFGPDGAPYLRGTWVGDPYPPELPPRNTYTYTTRVTTLAAAYTPRAQSTARDRGGYFIDQNSGWPTNHTAMDTVTETAGLCTLCHDSAVDTMDFYTSSSLWRFAPPGKNGHSNAALGGTRSASLISDLFTGNRYLHGMAMQMNVPNTPWNCGYYGDECDPAYPLLNLQSWSCESDCYNLRNSGWFGGPVNSTTRGGGDYANWYGTGTIGGASGAGSMAHRFTCSKCHSPHATGLPALLPQNCIDPVLSGYTINGYSGANVVANNCHRKTSTSDGWHILAPGQ